MTGWGVLLGACGLAWIWSRWYLASRARRQQLDLARAMNEAIAQRSPFLRGMAGEIGALAVKIGRQLGLPAAELQDLRIAALLCDVGVAAVPMSILRKGYEWSAEEQEIYERHPIDSARILKGVPPLARYAEAVRLHHVKFEVEPNVSLAAKIIGLADDFVRCRKMMSQDRSMLVIEKLCGTQYDPLVVGALRSVLDDTITLR